MIFGNVNLIEIYSNIPIDGYLLLIFLLVLITVVLLFLGSTIW